MKRGTAIALLLLTVLVALYFVTNKEPASTVEAPYSLKKMEELHRIELTRPSPEGRVLVVLEREEDGVWWLAKPLKARLDARAASAINNAFLQSIGTDDLKLSKTKLAEYELEEGKAIDVELFERGKSAAAASFKLGKEVGVKQTGVKRSYIATPKGRPLRLRASLEALRKPINVLRSKNIITPGTAGGVVAVTIASGTDPNDSVGVVREDGKWRLQSGDMPLEPSVVNALAGSMTSLMATGFVDDTPASELGLDPPQYRVSANRGQKELVAVLVSRVGDAYYAKLPNEPHVYKIAPAVGRNLTADYPHLRDRVMRPMDRTTISAVEFASGVAIQKNGESWTVVRPSKAEAVKGKVIASLGTIANLRVSFYVELPNEVTGLEKPSDRVTLVEDGEKRVLALGNRVGDSDNRYAKWEDLKLEFVLPKFALDRLKPQFNDLAVAK